MNIVRVYKDEKWLNENLIVLEKFWKDVEYYRNNDIKLHPKFPKQKKIIDLTTDESEEIVLLDYAFIE